MLKKGLFGLVSKVGDVVVINWYLGYMVLVIKVICERIKVVDLVVEVCDVWVCYYFFFILLSIFFEIFLCYC